MGIVNAVIEKIKTDRASSDALCSEIDNLISDISGKLSDLCNYIDNNTKSQVKISVNNLIKKVDGVSSRLFANKRKLAIRKRQLFELQDSIDTCINEHNDNVARQQISNARKIIGRVENRELDDQQIKCIIKPMRNHLVIAGAGTGKTTTIVGKVKYLLATKQCEPKDILLI